MVWNRSRTVGLLPTSSIWRPYSLISKPARLINRYRRVCIVWNGRIVRRFRFMDRRSAAPACKARIRLNAMTLNTCQALRALSVSV